MTYEQSLSAAWADAKVPRTSDAPTVISTFGGGGGSSLGYKMAGFDVRTTVEWMKYPAACYRRNFPETVMIEGDIAKVDSDDLLLEAGLRPGELDVFDGSPPCQGFSTSGNRDIADPRNSLFREYVRLLRGLMPKVFVMENVSGMVKGKMLWVFKQVMQELKTSGYRVSCRVMDAKWFGVPQSRQRTIFIGIRDDLGIDPSHPKAQQKPTTIAEACPWLATLSFVTGPRGPKWNPYNKDFAVKGEPVNTIPKLPGGVYNPTNGEGLVAGVYAEMSGGYNPDGSWKRWNRPFDAKKEPILTITKTPGRFKVAGVFATGWSSGTPVPADGPAPTLMKGGIGGSSNSQFFTNAPDPQGYIPAPEMKGKAADLAAQLMPGQRGSDLPSTKKGSWRDLVRVNPGATSPTIQKHGGFNGQPRVLHPVEVRGLSIGEVKRLGSFPDEYQFITSEKPRKDWENAWGVVGNSVPPLFMRAIALHIRGLLNGNKIAVQQ